MNEYLRIWPNILKEFKATAFSPSNITPIVKTRSEFVYDGNTWFIDVFKGENEGLIMAEIEMPHEDYEFNKPNFLEKEVTNDVRYHNNNLAVTPYVRRK